MYDHERNMSNNKLDINDWMTSSNTDVDSTYNNWIDVTFKLKDTEYVIIYCFPN